MSLSPVVRIPLACLLFGSVARLVMQSGEARLGLNGFVQPSAMRRPAGRVAVASRVSSGLRALGRQIEHGDTVAVVGASGNVGKLAVLRLLDEGYRVHAVVRSSAAGKRLLDFLGPERANAGKLELFEADLWRSPTERLEAAFADSAGLLLCAGTTAFPTKAWAGGGVGPDEVGSRVWEAWTSNNFNVRKALDELSAAGLNTPDQVDARGIEAVARAASQVVSRDGALKRCVLMSSLGVTRRDKFPFVILNAGGVLDAKARGEAAVRIAAQQSGFDFTIVRPGQLFGGPYDNNFYLGTLFQLDKDAATRGVSVSLGDEVAGDTLRSALAEVLVQSLRNPAAAGADFTVLSVEGEAPDAEELQATLAAKLAET